MVYFRCTSSGSGKGNTVIVTCAEQFAGVAITIAKIGKSYTKVCPLSAPYVVKFYGVEAGTYTVSATVSGQTYSAEVIVQDVSCVLNYGFTWKTWVDTASQLDSTDYASLSEVLADEEAVRELFLEHACVDYMASVGASNADLETIIENDLCAKWINNRDYALDFLGANVVIKALMDEADKYGYGEWVITDDSTTPPTWGAKGNVPVMTANNAPYGEASVTSYYGSGYEAFRAFDGDDSTQWASSGVTNERLQYKFVNPICPKRVTFKARYLATLRVKTFSVLGSNDGTNWETIREVETLPNTSTEDYARDLNCEKYYLYLALGNLTSYGADIEVKSLQFYGRELKVSVPTMTSNTAPFGEAIILPSANSSTPAWKMFDESLGTFSGVPDRTAYPHRFGYIFNNKDIVLKMITVQSISDHGEYNPKNCSLEYTEDGTTWEEASETFTLANSTALQAVPISGNSIKGKGFRIVATNGYYTTYDWSGVGELQFYGLDYSEKEFETGVTKKWLYDHGVELEEMTLTNTNANATGEKRDSDVYLKKTGTSNMSAITAQLDLSPYSLCRMKYGKEGDKGAGSRYGCLDVMSSLVYDNNDSFLVATKYITSDMPNNISLDISSINQTRYIGLSVRSASNVTTYATLNELWLE